MSAGQPEVDAAVAHAQVASPATRPGLVLATTILASSLAFIDGSVVNVGLPAIGHSLGAGPSALQWIITGYLLPLSSLLLVGGAAGDRYGRRRLLVAGTLLFALFSATCALSGSVTLLIASRIGQGVGAALLMPNSLAILGSAFTGASRGRAIGTWASASAIAGAIGPVLGGFLIDHVDWRAIFLINLPIAVAAAMLALFAVPESEDAESAPLDSLGGGLATATLALLTWGLIRISTRAVDVLGLVVLAISAAFAVGFAAVERRRGTAAMLPPSLFASKSFVVLTAATLLLYGALGAFMILVPYVMIVAGGYRAADAGAALLPFPLIIALTARLMGGVSGRLGARLPLTVGPLVAAAGYLLLLRVPPHPDYFRDILPAILVVALGMSGAVAPLTTAVIASVDAAHTGAASGANSAVARMGGLIATALLGSVLASRGAGLIANFHLAALASALAAILSAASARQLPAGLGSQASD